MSSTDALMDDPHIRRLLSNAGTTIVRMAIVKRARASAALMLADAVKRVPVDLPHVITAYKAKGLNPVWMLNDNNDAIRFWLTLPSHSHTPEEKKASDLLRACVAAEEAGDVSEFRLMQIGKTQVEGNRIKGTLSVKLSKSIQKRIASQYWRRVEDGQKYGASKELAGLHEVSTTTIHTIVKRFKPNSIDK